MPIPLIVAPTVARPLNVIVFKETVLLIVADKVIPDPCVKTYSPSP